jgi:hypothetical protein
MTYMERRRKYSSNSFACRRYKELSGQHNASSALTAVKTRYPSYRRLGGPRCRSGRVQKISTAPGFVLQTSKDVASCRTDCAIPAANEYDMIYLLTVIGLTPGGSSTVHIYTQTIRRTIQNKQYIEHTTILEECGPCPVLASYTLAFALQPRKKHGKTSVRVAASKNMAY